MVIAGAAASAGSARADPTTVFVHVDSPQRVDLARQAEPDDEFIVVCTSPCDRSLPSSGTYRIQSTHTDGDETAAIRASDDLALSPFDARQVIVVEPKSPIAFGFGLGLVIVGGNALGAAAFLALVSSALADGGPVDESGPAVLAGAGALTLAMGIVLLANSRNSGVTINRQESAPAKQGPLAARPRNESVRYPAPVTMPLFQISF